MIADDWQVAKLGLNYPDKIWGAWARFWGLCPPHGPKVEPSLAYTIQRSQQNCFFAHKTFEIFHVEQRTRMHDNSNRTRRQEDRYGRHVNIVIIIFQKHTIPKQSKSTNK